MMRRFLGPRRIEEFGLIPRGYGLAWRERDTLHAVLYRIPLNLIMRAWRQACYWCMQGGGAGCSRQELEDECTMLRWKNALLNQQIRDSVARFDAATELLARIQGHIGGDR